MVKKYKPRPLHRTALEIPRKRSQPVHTACSSRRNISTGRCIISLSSDTAAFLANPFGSKDLVIPWRLSVFPIILLSVVIIL